MDHLGAGSSLLQSKLQTLLDEGRKKQAESSTNSNSINFRASVIKVSDSNLKVKLLKASDLHKEFEATLEQDKSEAIDNYYVQTLSAYDDVLDAASRALNDGKSSVQDMNSLLSYLKYKKLKCMMQRGEKMVKELEENEATLPHELVHIYDSLLQSAKLVRDVGGGQTDDNFILLAEANVLRFRALRCYKLGLTYENLGEFKNAIGERRAKHGA